MRLYKDRKWLYQKYVIENLSTRKIARICNSCKSTILNWLIRFNIERKVAKDYDRKHYRKYDLNENVFNHLDNSNKAYWVGFIMADGCISNKNNTYGLYLTLALKDIGHLEKFCKFLNTNKPIKVRISNSKIVKNSIVAGICINSKFLIKDLRKYGIVPRKTSKENIKNIPRFYLRDFIRGYLDGDGCVYLTKTYPDRGYIHYGVSIVFTSASKEILEQIQDILIENCRLKQRRIKLSVGNNCYSLQYGGNKIAYRIFNYLYKDANTYLWRKYKKFLDAPLKTLESMKLRCDIIKEVHQNLF